MFESRSERIFIIMVVHNLYSAPNCSKACSVYSAVYGTLDYKEPLKSFEIRVGHIPAFGLSSVTIWPLLCRKQRIAVFTLFIYHIYSWSWLD